LQVRYAYSLTCHKAQGGEAEKVIIDNPYASSLFELKWLYTAITRAKNYLIILGDLNLLVYAANHLSEKRQTTLKLRLSNFS
jgi:exodeoxyribonuclease V alpha subunit